MLRMVMGHIRPVSLMLAKAFKEDPIDAYIFPNPEERIKKIPLVYELLIRTNYSNSQAFITSPNIEGVAVWIKSGYLESSWKRIIFSGNIRRAMRIGLRAIRRIQKFDRFFHKKHKELAPREHWYLAILAVDTKYQGMGFARKLLDGMFLKTDFDDLPYFVETEGEKNVSIYKHFGFQIIDEYQAPQTNETIVAMLRKPKPRLR